MNGHLTSVTLNTGDTLWTLRKQNARLLPAKVGLGRLGLSLSYDDRGNVRERWVADCTAWQYGTIDNLSLTYNGNQLRKVTDQCATGTVLLLR